MKELLLLLAGAGLTLLGALAQAALDRRTVSTSKILELRLEALNRIWTELVATRNIFEEKFQLGHARWVEVRGRAAEDALNRFRNEIDRSQVLLDANVTKVLREIDAYLYLLLSEEQQKPSAYIEEFGGLLHNLERTIEATLNRVNQRITLALEPRR